MLDNLDKCYHVVCAIPVVQTFVGGAFAVKDTIGIIKDIAMKCLFPDFEANTKVKISNLKKLSIELQDMQVQRNSLFYSALKGDDKAKKLAVEGMEIMQNTLKKIGMFFPSYFIKNQNPTDYLEVDRNTHLYIHQAVLHCRDQVSSLNGTLYFVEAVPARTRLYNLATAVISMIPTYRIGTVYNLGILAYHTFIKH